MLFTLLKMVFFGLVAVYTGVVLLEHGTETVRFTMRPPHDVDWPNLLKDLVLLVVLVFSATWVKHAWDQRHHGSASAYKKARRQTSKVSDNYRIPK
jgi:hypothetical protein